MKKKVLLVCKEQTSVALQFIRKFIKDFIVDILFFMPHEDENSYHVAFQK